MSRQCCAHGSTWPRSDNIPRERDTTQRARQGSLGRATECARRAIEAFCRDREFSVMIKLSSSKKKKKKKKKRPPDLGRHKESKEKSLQNIKDL